MIKNILGCKFKYENDKMYRLNIRNNKWNCCSDLKPNKLEYINVKINKKDYKLHRIIYKYFNPDWDLEFSYNNQIDHININKLDNRIENLRLATCSQNRRNQNKKPNCSSKYIGVSWDKKVNKWVAQISINNKVKHLGLFDTEEDAYECYKKKYEELMN